MPNTLIDSIRKMRHSGGGGGSLSMQMIGALTAVGIHAAIIVHVMRQ